MSEESFVSEHFFTYQATANLNKQKQQGMKQYTKKKVDTSNDVDDNPVVEEKNVSINSVFTHFPTSISSVTYGNRKQWNYHYCKNRMMEVPKKKHGTWKSVSGI